MPYNIKMFDSKTNIVALESGGYSSVVKHSHEFVEVVYIKKGFGMSILGEEEIKIVAGDVFVIANKNICHSIVPYCDEKDFLLMNIIFPFDFFDLNYSLFRAEKIYKIDDIAGGKEIFEKIHEEYTEKGYLFDKVNYALTLNLLCNLLRQNPKSRNKKQEQQKFLKSYIDHALSFMHDNYDKKITIDDIANACGVCRAYLQRLFKKKHNTSVLEYLIKYRIEQSCKLLLNTDYSISTISEMVGFNDVKYFYLKFKEIAGMTPVNFKKKNGGEENDSDDSN